MSKVIIQTLLIIFTIIFTACSGGSSSTAIATEVVSAPILESLTFSMDENTTVGTTVATVSVIDRGGSEIISFTLSDTTHFAISSNGELTTVSTFDYETTALYNLTVFATNSEGNSSSVAITVNILDVIEVIVPGVPTLESSTVNVAENTISGIAIGALTILDIGDSSINSITLSGTGNEKFDVATNGVITLITGAILDYETSPSYALSAFATNTQGDSQSVSVNINVTNIVDTAAVLSSFTGAINENASIGSLVGTVNVLDPGDSAITSFTLSDTTNFNINASGEITTKTALDYETQIVYHLSVYAINGAGNSNTVNITINILDIFEQVVINIPTVVVIMNWNNYSENDPLLWHNKIFNKNDNSLNRKSVV